MRVLILDLTHGADALAMEYHALGHEVVCVDVYHTATVELCYKLEGMGIRVMECSPEEWFDLLVIPIHCPDKYIGPASFGRRITHHQAVGELARFRFPIVEVTGIGAKTSTSHLIAHMIVEEGRSVLLLSSRGLFRIGEGTTIFADRMSIAPASVLRMAKIAVDCDVGVFEVSLGGTGSADVGVITTLNCDYPIAQGTRTAFDGKSQMVSLARGKVVVPTEMKRILGGLLPEGVEMTTFGQGGGIEATIVGPLRLGDEANLEVRTDAESHPVLLSSSLLAPAYLTAINAALAAALALGVSQAACLRALGAFQGVPGRAQVSRMGSTWLIRDRNPGISASSVGWELDALDRYAGVDDVGVVVDPINVNICEKIDSEAILHSLMQHPNVRGAYLLRPPHSRASRGFQVIDDVKSVMDQHQVLLWCTKEGYA